MAATDTKPVGGKPDKQIRDALLGAIRQSPEKLKRAAESVLDRAADGDQAAMAFMADRIDGKAVQPIANDGNEPFNVKTSLTVAFVAAHDSDT